MQEKPAKKSNDQRSREMRERLMASARALFVEKGFAETGTPEIVRHAEVTRGALYHHFADKTDLFRAVAVAEADAVRADIEEMSKDMDRAEDAMRAGTSAFFRAMAREGRARILLIDGPAALGVREMDDIHASRARASLAEGLRALLPGASDLRIETLAITLSAAFDRAALAISEGEPAQAYEDALMELIGGL